MKLSELQLFVAVAEAGGMTQAAARLGLSQPAISRTIREMEARLRVDLLRRTGRGVELTEAGELVLDFARRTLSSHGQLVEALIGVSARPSEISIAVPQRTGVLLIPPLLRAFAGSDPELTVHVFEEPSERSIGLLHAGELDGAILYAPPLTAAATTENLAAERLHLVGAAELVGDTDSAIELSQVARLPLLLPSRRWTMRRLVDSALHGIGASARIARELDTTEALLAFAMEREGVTILPYSNVHRECAAGQVIARPIASPVIARHLGLSLATRLDRRLAGTTVRAVRAAIEQAAPLARWQHAA